MTTKKKLPIGIEDFEKIRKNDFYYIDKTSLIAELLSNWGEVNLFTRPRRFGKSLSMSMLKHFLEIGCEEELFDGLKILREKELCKKYMGKFPVISITLKGVDGLSYEAAAAAMRSVVGTEAERFSFLVESERLTANEKEKYRAIIRLENGVYTMDDVVLVSALKTLSMLISKHYSEKTIILIDEYDVPLDKAFQWGYYEEMVSLIRGFLGNALKTNEYLQFAVLTGCLRISKESIFTGLNNMNVMSITDEYFDEYFGFTDAEVQELLDYYGVEHAFKTMKQWYDGYRFGNTSIYCPWDVLKYCQALTKNRNAVPENYWANTSGNAMVRRFIDKANQQTRNEIEKLIAGESITKEINMELTYNELDSTIEHLWSVLFTTGYLTQQGREGQKGYTLTIPNREIRKLFISQIKEWFKDTTHANASQIKSFCAAFPNADADLIEKMLNDYLWGTISIRDTAVQNDRKENFYHGMLLGLLQYQDNWLIKSNAESGVGFSDILIETPERTGIVIEVKYAHDGNLEKCCREAEEQIEGMEYTARLVEDGMKTIVRYGVAFYKKRCKVTCCGSRTR
ncbi:ATP-binding protein [Blautia schinkii]|nr:ATP-binding protein [Blautia schinkii]